MKKSTLLELFGWLGTAFVIISYVLLTSGTITDDWRYHLLILVGSFLVALISFVKKAWQPFVLNVLFALLALLTLLK